MLCDVYRFNIIYMAKINRRENDFNILQDILHRIAGKTALAVWGNRKYADELDEILLHKESIEEKRYKFNLSKGVDIRQPK